jgi:hypothetical protein
MSGRNHDFIVSLMISSPFYDAVLFLCNIHLKVSICEVTYLTISKWSLPLPSPSGQPRRRVSYRSPAKTNPPTGHSGRVEDRPEVIQ